MGTVSACSERQAALLLLNELDPGRPGLILSVVFQLSSDAEAPRLTRAVTELIIRHPEFQSRFVRDAHGWSWDIPDASQPTTQVLQRVVLRHGSAGDIHRLRELSRTAINLDAGPAASFILGTLAADVEPAFLAVSIHHSITDLWSVGLMFAELAALTGQPDGRPVRGEIKEPPPLSAVKLDRAAEFWKRQWLDFENDGTSSPFRVDERLRGGVTRELVRTPIDVGNAELIDATARAAGTSRYGLLLAAEVIALCSMNGDQQAVVATTFHGRSRETASAFGYHANTIGLPIVMPSREHRGELRNFVRSVGQTLRGATAYGSVPAAALTTRVTGEQYKRMSRISAALLLQQDLPGSLPGMADALLHEGVCISVGGIELTTVLPVEALGPFPSTTILTQKDDNLVGWIETDPELLPPDHGIGLAAVLSDTVQAITENDWSRISRHHPVPPGGTRPATGGDSGNGSQDVAFERRTLLHERIQQVAARHGDRVAVEVDDLHITYSQLWNLVLTFRQQLRLTGVRGASVVGVLVGRQESLIPLLLAIMASGGAYVPLDPHAPRARHKAILAVTNCDYLVTDTPELVEGLGENAVVVPLRQIDDDVVSQDPIAEPVPQSDPIAYVLTTSGSTGTPKAVAIRHSAVYNLLDWAAEQFGTGLRRTLAVTPLTFDLSVFELFAPLVSGHTVVLCDSILELRNGSLQNADITFLNTTPSFVVELAEARLLPATLEVINVAGEALRSDMVARIKAAAPLSSLYNSYGPSETTTYSTSGVMGDNPTVDIGAPIKNTEILLVDDDLHPVALGAPGNVLIGGAGLAAGYWKNAEKTAERFIPSIPRAGNRLYHSGDQARWLPGGVLEYLGRVDDQVKIRGVRVELREVEAVLRQLTGVREVAVIADKSEHEVVLCAFVEAEDTDVPALESGIRRHIRQQLPPAFMPRTVEVTDHLPRNSHGKIDRALLATRIPRRADPPSSNVDAPPGAEYLRLAGLWAALLSVQPQGPEAEFFELGGQSLQLVVLSAMIESAFSVSVTPAQLWESPTLGAQLEMVRGGEKHHHGDESVERLPPVRRHRPATDAGGA